jgi:hypothetical protein
MDSEPKPVVGMDCTMCVGSDSYPYRIVSISKSGKVIELKELDHTPAEGFDYYANQKYTYKPFANHPDNDMPVTIAKMSRAKGKAGNWYSGGSRVFLGKARYYQDPSY